MKITKLAPIAAAFMVLTLATGSAFADPQHGWGRGGGYNNGHHNGWGRNNDNGYHNGRGYGQRTPWGQRDNRIRNGIQNGSLTHNEAKQLMQGERRIDRARNVALRDGDVSRQEARRLHQLRSQQNRNIYHQEHDRQNR